MWHNVQPDKTKRSMELYLWTYRGVYVWIGDHCTQSDSSFRDEKGCAQEQEVVVHMGLFEVQAKQCISYRHFKIFPERSSCI